MAIALRRLALLGAAMLLGACALPNAQKATIDGRATAFSRQGEAPPTVVFEAGLGDGMSTWSPVLPKVSAFASVFAYDRPGYGGSASAEGPRTGERLVSELRSLLRRTGARPPYVLVGHSFGGSLMELFARTHPEEVVGLVLVESRHHDFSRRCQIASALVCEPPSLLVAAMPGDALAEYRAMPETMRQLRNAPPLSSDMPLVVLTGMRKIVEGPTFRDAWLGTQKELAAQSKRGEHVVCDGCGHYVHRDQPQLVVDAIRRVVQASRR
ncbi:MAG TPA: alpha/beta hydrolase [Albitalea sp.]|uniref:alpha/beta fold hydrolase n=1 Tax=Piscinibacter sp. TaxID=1903157 RepID=UPI002ED04BD7